MFICEVSVYEKRKFWCKQDVSYAKENLSYLKILGEKEIVGATKACSSTPTPACFCLEVLQ
jgi:hypothetical protein